MTAALDVAPARSTYFAWPERSYPGTSDAVGALVVATAVERGATMILTTDPNDLKILVDATGLRYPPLVRQV